MSNEQASTSLSLEKSVEINQAEEGSDVIKTWLKAGDAQVEHEIRRPFWITMINNIKERTLVGANVLDFGCARGAFLDTLYQMKPFASGIGVDISEDAILAARSKVHAFPNQFLLGSGDSIANHQIHVAFSFEVLWLLRDLQEHARYMNRVIAPGGVYYAATGCHTDHPRWKEWCNIISKDSTLAPANHSPEDFVRAFSAEGFTVTARQLCHRDFIPVLAYPEYFPTVLDTIRYYSQEIIVFRFEKSAELENLA